MVAARAGETWAQEALYRRYTEMANRLAYRLLGRDSDVDDLVQDGFVEAFTCLDRLREPDAFVGFLRAILVNRASKLIRRRRLMNRLGLRSSLAIDLDALVSPSAPADVGAELRKLYRVVESLPAKLRVPLILRRVEGLSLEEVATLTETSLATVKRRLVEADRLLARAQSESP